MTKTERYISLVAAILTIFIFVSGVSSLKQCSNQQGAEVSQAEHPSKAPPVVDSVARHSGVIIKKDPVFVSLLKFLAVLLFFLGGVALTIPCFLVDFIIAAAGYSFPCTRTVWITVWDRMTISWFWDPLSGIKFFLLILVILGASWLFSDKTLN